MMKKLLLLFTLLAMAIPLWAGEQTVTIHRNDGQFEEANGVYYCYKSGLMMTFTSGLNNPNYLVEHQQVYFEVRSVNPEYIIKKIVFHCVDNTTSDNLDCFYWGPSTISIVQNWTYPSSPGTYTYSGYTGTWVGETNKIQFTTMAKPVRFGSVDITFEKETGDIYELVISDSQLQEGHKYAIVNQYYPENVPDEGYAMSTLENETYGTIGRTKVSFVPNTNKHKVIINDETRIITLQTGTGVTDRPWYLGSGSSTLKMRRASSTTGTAASAKGYPISFQNISAYPEFFPVKIEIGTEADNYPAKIRFCDNSTNVPKPTDTQYALAQNNYYDYFKVLDITSANQFASSQRVHLYQPAQNFIITTERHPEQGGEITMTDGVLEINGQMTSQEFEEVSFYVSVNDGYTIQSVTATDANNNPVTIDCTQTTLQGNRYTFTMPAANVNIVVNYVQASYHVIHTECDPTYGGEYTFNSGAFDMNTQVVSYAGNNVNFGITASLGYVFTGITATSEDGQSTVLPLTDNGDGTYSFIMPDNDVTLSATFDRVIGDIFQLVEANSDIVEGSTYIIVSQTSEVAMKHWNRSDATFQATPIVEWVTTDKKQVRVDDKACFFTLDDFSETSATSNKKAVMNTLVGYLGYNGTNVTSTPDKSEYNKATMFISSTVSNFLCTFDSIGNEYVAIRYDVNGNFFKMVKYTSSPAAERVWLYRLIEDYHNISTVCTPTEGGSITVSSSSAQAGETVTFSMTENSGYELNGFTVTNTDPSITTTITVTDNGDGTYSFTMPDNAVTITANFDVLPVSYDIKPFCVPEQGGYMNINGHGNNETTSSMPGSTVNFEVHTNWGYRISSVTAVNWTTGETVDITLTGSSDAGNTYTFTMPVGEVHITAKFYENLFLLGTAMSRTGWCASGPEFTFDPDNDQYYIDVYFKGIRGVNGMGDDEYGYFSMAKQVDNITWQTADNDAGNWGNVQGRLAAQNSNSDDNIVGDGSTDVVLYNDRPDNAFKIKAGVYRIIINHDLNRMSIVQYKPSIEFNPVSGSPVNLNDIVYITSNLQDTVHALANRYSINEVAQKFRNTTDDGANWTSDDNNGQNGAQAVISHTGTTTVVAEAWIGYITARDTAEYVIRNITYVVNPDDNAGTITGPTSSSPGITVTVTPTAATGYYLDNVAVTYVVDGVYQSVTVTDNGNGTYSFEMPDSNVTVTANFAEGYRIFAECLPPEGGSISVASTAQAGETVTFSVSANTGYVLTNLVLYDDVSGQYIYPDYNSDNDTYSFIMPSANVYLDAYFGEGYTITTVVNPAQGGVLTVTPVASTYGMNAPISVELTPANDYEVIHVTMTNNTTQQVIELYPDPTALDNGEYHYFFRMPASHVTVTAYLAIPQPLGYIERYDTKEDGDPVVVSDELIGVWMAKQYVWAKDQARSNVFLEKASDPNIRDFIRQYMDREVGDNNQMIDWQPREWDQSNWVMLDFSQLEGFKNWETDPTVREKMEAFVDHKIKAGTISGTYHCLGHTDNDLSQYELYPKVQHVIVLDKEPEAVTSTTEQSLGYPGYHQDPKEWIGKRYDDPSEYMYNHYMTYNFKRNNTRSNGNLMSAAALSYYSDLGLSVNENLRYFFMTPKDQEVAQVSGVWVGQKTFTFGGEEITADVFDSYGFDPVNKVNQFDFHGAFYVPSWEFNRLISENEYNSPSYGKPGVDDGKDILKLDEGYIFHAAIKYLYIEPEDVSGSRAPKHAAPTAAGDQPEFYMVYPLDLMSRSDAFTAVREVRAQDATMIESIRYYNIMGQESQTPFEGINIEVIRYKDGSMISRKILR